ncbi:MAG: hypothetical protein NVSMB64_28990 [Candidatus Velthaea sp.]
MRAALAALAFTFLPLGAPAELQTDPLVLYKTMKSAYDKGAGAGWHFADELDYFSSVLDAGRAFELRRRDDPANALVKGITVDLATRLNYNPLTNRDAAEWYVRLAAETYANDPDRGAAAKALIVKLDADDGNFTALARDADADATANVTAFPSDAEALLDQVDADLRGFKITKDVRYRSLAIQRAAQPAFPIGIVPEEIAKDLLAYAQAARAGTIGYTSADQDAARALFSHRASTRSIPIIGRVLSHQSYLVITAPADEYFGHTKLSPIGVRNEVLRIGKYLDVGWGARMTPDALYVVDAIDDWRHQYPRDYELPRLLLNTYKLLDRIDSPQAHDAEAQVRKVLTVEYNTSTEARTLLAS